MTERAYKFDTRVFSGIAVIQCRDTHYHSDCIGSLTETLDKALQQADAGIVVLDMSGVRLFSSSALRAVRAVHVRAMARDGRIVAASGGELAINVLKFAPFIFHFETVAEALKQYSPDAACAFAKAEG